MAAGDFTTLANLKAYLTSGSISSVDDAMLTRVITAASAFIRKRTGRDILQTTYASEVHNGNGKSRMTLKQFPITAVSSVLINTVSIPAAVDALHFGYLFDETTVYLTGYNISGTPFNYSDSGQWFSKGPQNCSFSYVAGYAPGSVELFDIEQVCIDLVALWATERKRIGQTSLNVGPEHISYLVNEPAGKRTMLALDQYRRRFVPT